ncbi:MAG: hypothetical protein H0T42_14520 [Deltaproteobacteria bacterium]|nr:hypothetical protein [Deltaproteobacteria bacterium]
MRTNSSLVLSTALVAVSAFAGCGGKGKLPGGMPGKPDMPGGLGGMSGEVDPDTCENYASSTAGARFKAFLQATKRLQTTAAETAEVVKQSCITMGKEMKMSDAEFTGETKDICAKVITTYQDNLKVSLKGGAKLKVEYKPAVCTIDASASASAAAKCEGSGGATAGTGGSSGGGSAECKAAGAVNASLDVECTEAELKLSADAKLVVDKSKLEMTLSALRSGLPKLLSIKARLEPMQKAVEVWAKAAADLKDMGPKFVNSFGDQAMCISGQIAASVRAASQIEANVSVSVSVTASASATAGG